MAQSIDPLQSFTGLADGVPQWLASLEDLNTQCDEQYERFYRLTKYGQVKLTRKKHHDSTESLRPKKEAIPPMTAYADAQREPAPAEADVELSTPADKSPDEQASLEPAAAAEASRKRKPASDLSGPSAPNRYRTKSMVVVYYDSDIQDGFASLVKQLANARSTLRKGKNTATFQARMSAMGLPAENPSRTYGDALDPKAMLASFGRNRPGQSGAAADKQKYKSFDDADRDLEESQTLAEKAAHQLLRDGDSRIEIEAMRKRFRAILALAEKEVERLKSQASNDTSQPKDTSSASELSPSKPNAPSITAIPKGSTLALSTIDPLPRSTHIPTVQTSPLSTKNITPIEDDGSPLVPSQSPAPPMSGPKEFKFAAVGPIEVDDGGSDVSSVKIDMTAIRRVARRA